MEYVILAITDDELELPVGVYNSFNEMARKLNISIDAAKNKVYQHRRDQKRGCYYIKVNLEEEKPQ